MSANGLALLAGFSLAVLVALAAWRARALSWSGALAAALLGTIIFGLGGIGWAALLLGFFISSSLLSRLFGRQKARYEEKFSKGSQRDAGQVAANGGVAGAFVLLHALFPGALWPWLGFAGALAAANADTWATELGVLSHSTPRLVTSGRPVERGTSGGVSGLGLAAAAAGAAVIGLLAVVFWQGRALDIPGAPGWLAQITGAGLPALPMPHALLALAGITAAGLAGSLLDSFLGATVQAIYLCPRCEKETERHPLHLCGTATQPIRGWLWMNNDLVNVLCTLAGALLAARILF
jgi:uncharacterized protein (TIGR00297 family)